MGQQCCGDDNIHQGGFDNFHMNHDKIIMEEYRD